MNMNFITILSLGSVSLLAAMGVVCARLYSSLRQSRALAMRQGAELQALRSDMGALCSGAKGVGERLNKLEHLLRHQAERQDQLELRSSGERPYQQAIKLVHKGAGARELVDAFGMTRTEADLIVMMHQVDKAG